MTIWKFDIGESFDSWMEMPKGAKILSVQIQKGRLCLWAIVNPDAERVPRHIVVVGTGHELGFCNGAFINTIQMAGGDLIWHIFDLGEGGGR